MIKAAILLFIFGATMLAIGAVLDHLICVKKIFKRHPSRLATMRL
jgi:hypothetical protein